MISGEFMRGIRGWRLKFREDWESAVAGALLR